MDGFEAEELFNFENECQYKKDFMTKERYYDSLLHPQKAEDECLDLSQPFSLFSG